MPTRAIAVVGGGLAGLRACEGLRARGYDDRITLIGTEVHQPYDRPPLSKQFLAGEWGPDRVMLHTADQLATLELDLRLGPAHGVVGLDLGRRRLSLAGGEVVDFDGLVIASGSHARRLPGISELPGTYVLRTLDDATALRGVLSRPGVHLGLAGAGFIGLEVAATARKLGAQVTVVEPLDVPLGRVLGPVAGRACEMMHREEGVRFHLGTTIESAEVSRPGPAIRGDGGGSDGEVGGIRCRLSDDTTLEVDALLVGVGAAPSVDWLRESGLPAGPDGVRCDESLIVDNGVVVAGDVARWPLRSAGRLPLPAGRRGASEQEFVRVEHRTNAAEQGDLAAGSLLADLGLMPPPSPEASEELPSYLVPYVWSDQFDVKIQVLGLPRPDDEVVIVEGDPGERRFVALHGRGGRLEAVVGFRRPRLVMSMRPLLERGATLDEAIAAAG